MTKIIGDNRGDERARKLAGKGFDHHKAYNESGKQHWANCYARAHSGFQEKSVVSQICRTLVQSPLLPVCFKNCFKLKADTAPASRRARICCVVLEAFSFSCLSALKAGCLLAETAAAIKTTFVFSFSRKSCPSLCC